MASSKTGAWKVRVIFEWLRNHEVLSHESHWGKRYSRISRQNLDKLLDFYRKSLRNSQKSALWCGWFWMIWSTFYTSTSYHQHSSTDSKLISPIKHHHCVYQLYIHEFHFWRANSPFWTLQSHFSEKHNRYWFHPSHIPIDLRYPVVTFLISNDLLGCQLSYPLVTVA